MASIDDKRHAYQFLIPCLTGDVAHARVLHALIETGSVSYKELGISQEDVEVFLTLSRIADPKERAIMALRGCREGRVLANFGVIQSLLQSEAIGLTDLREGDDSILKVGSDLGHFSNEYATQLERILPLEEPAQD